MLLYYFFLPLLLLPIFEIVGFVVIGGSLGAGYTLLWLAVATAGGVRLMRGRSHNLQEEAQILQDDGIFVVQGMFDRLCLFIAGILLVFPGFISDFLAVPFLIAPLRHWIFKRQRDNPDSFLRRHMGHKRGQTIDAEYSRMDTPDSRELPPE